MSEKLCACGCGLPAEKGRRVKRGHLKRVLPTHCKCGCGQPLEHKSVSSGYIAEYIHGHNNAYRNKSKEERRRILAPNIAKAVERRLELNQDPEWRVFDSEQKRKGQSARWEKVDDRERVQHGERSVAAMSTEGYERWRTGYKNRDLVRHAQKMREAWGRRREDPEAYRAYCERLSEGVKQAWRDGKLDHTGTKSWYHQVPSGRSILVQSTWEAGCADAMDTMGLPFSRGGRVDLGECSWRPDFLVWAAISEEPQAFYLEVKGHPLAIAQFGKHQLPNIHHSPHPVAILLDPPPYPTDLNSFLDRLDWLHY
jgi:hypothetical protein